MTHSSLHREVDTRLAPSGQGTSLSSFVFCPMPVVSGAFVPMAMMYAMAYAQARVNAAAAVPASHRLWWAQSSTN